MNDVLIALKLQSLQDLNGESADQTSRHALEVILLDELVEVHTQQLEG